MAITPRIKLKNPLPTSPKNIFALGKFQNKNPMTQNPKNRGGNQETNNKLSNIK